MKAPLNYIVIVVEHCFHCDGDGIDAMVKDDDGKVAKGEQPIRCKWCEGTGHVVYAEARGER